MNIEIEDDVKRLTITGQDEHDQVVMKQELSDDELDNVAGGRIRKKIYLEHVDLIEDVNTYDKKYGNQEQACRAD